MPDAAGLLLDQTWRMHPDLCRYTSAAFYDGKLGGVGWGSGLRLVEVAHQGNTNASPEEAREVARLADQRPGRVQGRDGGQVPGPGGPGGHLLDGDLVGGRGASRA
jgi:hypothetical protein